MIPDGRSGTYRDDGEASRRELERGLLGQKLRPLIGAGHILQRAGLILVAQAAVGHADAAYGAGVNDAFDAGRSRRLEQVARTVDVGPVELVRIASPEPIVSRDVKDEAASGDGARKRGRVAQVADDGLGVKFPN